MTILILLMATYSLFKEGRMPLFNERTDINMKTGVERVAAKARQERDFCFTSLTHHLTVELCEESLHGIRKNSAAGVDQKDVKQTQEEFSQWIHSTLKSVHDRGYKAPPVKRVFIPKPGKRAKRPIGIPTVKDRCLQIATVKVLNAIYEQDFLNCSFGGRPRLSAHQAVGTLTTAIASKKVSWVYEADLKNFFGSLDHGWVMRFLQHRVKDPRITSLIKRWLNAGVMVNDKLEVTSLGTPQGGPISVLISNIYLHYVLDLWVEKLVKPKLKGEMHYVRYVDDFVLCFQHEEDAKLFERALANRLRKFSLDLEPTKTRLVEFGRFAVRESKRKGRSKPETIYFLGFTFYCTKNVAGKFKVGAKTEKSRLSRSMLKMKEKLLKIRHLPLEVQTKAINIMLVGHYRYYGIGGNFDSLKLMYRFTVFSWLKTLKTRSQKHHLTWERYNKILKVHHLSEPKIYQSYSRLRSLALL